MLIKPKKNKRGFTLIELIIVCAILVILAAIAIQSYLSLRDEATKAVTINNASQIASAINVWVALDKDHTPPAIADVQGWESYAAMQAVLGDLAPAMSDTEVAAAADKVIVDAATGVFKADAS